MLFGIFCKPWHPKLIGAQSSEGSTESEEAGRRRFRLFYPDMLIEFQLLPAEGGVLVFDA